MTGIEVRGLAELLEPPPAAAGLVPGDARARAGSASCAGCSRRSARRSSASSGSGSGRSGSATLRIGRGPAARRAAEVRSLGRRPRDAGHGDATPRTTRPADRDSPRRVVVALDGPASSGKSSVGAAAARELGYRFCDTGLLYRAVTGLALRRGVGLSDPAALVAARRRGRARRRRRRPPVARPGRRRRRDGRGPPAGGRPRPSARCRSVPEVRAALLARQRALAGAGRIVMAGRDIGTVVLPDADLKVFLDASAEERARRRAEERGLAPGSPEAAAILADLRRRDDLDRNRPVAPLRPRRTPSTSRPTATRSSRRSPRSWPRSEAEAGRR